MRAARFNPAPLALAAAITAALAAGFAPAALAQGGATLSSVMTISIPAQPLGQALNELARQANLQLSFPAPLVASKTAPAVSGQLTTQQALERVLAGSGLEAAVDGSSVLVRPARPAVVGSATLPVVQVTGAASSGLTAPYAGGQTARGGRVGLLGNKDLLDTPFSTTAYTAQLVEDQQAQNLGDVLVNDPTVRNTYSRGSGRDEFNIRGFTLFNYDISFNGLYGISPRNASSLIGVERVEVLRGPNALLNGMAPAGSVGGAINLVPKRAGAEPLNRLTLSYIDDGQFGTQVDLARRLGDDRQWGVRLNALKRSGDTPVDHSSEDLGAVTLGVDYQGEGVRIEADLGYQNRLTHARSSLLFPPGTGIAIAPVPNARTNFQPEWTYWKVKELSGVVRAEVDLSPDVTAFGAIGAMQYDFRSLQSAWLLQDDQGNLAGRPTRLNEYVDTTTAQAGVRGKFATGSVRHEAVLSVSALRSTQGTRRQNGVFMFSNLYNPSSPPEQAVVALPGIPKVGETRLSSVAVADTMSSSDGRIQLTVGARRQTVESSSFDAVTGAFIPAQHYDKSAITPVAAVVFKATDAMSVYGNYIEGLSQAPTPPSTVSNPDDRFPPSKSKQIEFGAKYDFGRFAATLSAFQIERPSGLTEANVFRVDGQQRNRGIELLTQGEIAPGLRLLAGAAYTDGKLVKTDGGANDGRTAPATPKVQLNLAGEWDAAFLPGLTFTARGLRTSEQYVDADNTQKIPGWTRYDIGARYRFMTGMVPVTIRAAVENLFDKNYWQSAAREGLTIGAPRTFLVSVSADF